MSARSASAGNLSNIRSRAVADRVAFTFEGIKRDGWMRGDQIMDVAVYSMLAGDWEKLRAKPNQ
ncbi:MAG TPA: GNAT family protein [Anaerolineae bacterium]|nr:GNAT family protein [Anaerolineae bacterium]